MIIPRRNIQEIITRYKLEPSLNDVYVEGRFDKHLFDKAFRELNISRPVYEIDTVEINDETLSKYGLTRGEKQEIIALCYELSLSQESHVRMLVDRDADEFLGNLINLNGLLYTRYCDIVGTFLSNECVRELVCDVGGVNCDDWGVTFDSIEHCAKTIFAFRVTLIELDIRQTVPSITKSLKKIDQAFTIDLDHLIMRLNLSNDLSGHIMETVRSKEKYVSALEARSACRGHDYLEILSWFIKKMNGNSGLADQLLNILTLLVPKFASEIVENVNR